MLAPGTLAAAFGIAPPWIINENLKPGSSFTYEIDMNTNDPSQDMLVKSKVAGDPEIMEWIKVRNQDNLMMPAGQQHVPLFVDIKVPSDAKAGKYRGDIGLTVMPKGVNGTDVSIYLGGHIAVELDVVNYDVTDYWVKSISVDPIIVGQPVNLNVTVKNLGNTPIENLKTFVEVFNKKGDLVGKGSSEKLTKVIQPQTVEVAQLAIPIPELDDGSYWINVSAMKGTKAIYQNRLYLAVSSPDINNVLSTSVMVGDAEAMKAAAEVVAMNEAPVPLPSEMEGLNANGGNKALAMTDKSQNNVQVKTTVTVRAPLTNQLIGIVIILLGVLILVTARIQTGLFKKFKGRK